MGNEILLVKEVRGKFLIKTCLLCGQVYTNYVSRLRVAFFLS